ncbi:hypothetical protein [Nostoc sp.]
MKESPVSVMVRGLLEKALCPQTQIFDELFLFVVPKRSTLAIYSSPQ